MFGEKCVGCTRIELREVLKYCYQNYVFKGLWVKSIQEVTLLEAFETVSKYNKYNPNTCYSRPHFQNGGFCNRMAYWLLLKLIRFSVGNLIIPPESTWHVETRKEDTILRFNVRLTLTSAEECGSLEVSRTNVWSNSLPSGTRHSSCSHLLTYLKVTGALLLWVIRKLDVDVIQTHRFICRSMSHML